MMSSIYDVATSGWVLFNLYCCARFYQGFRNGPSFWYEEPHWPLSGVLAAVLECVNGYKVIGWD